ncbi:MAG: SEL1-like repeat protein [Sulfurovaceae bacterium]|nr:SEL1-like repeat protein [Sulfurovaceae bacterium]
MDDIEANKAFNEDRYADSFKLYKQIVSETKDIDAMYMLGKHYFEGLGTVRDEDMAISLWKRASKAGSLDAKYALLEQCQTTAQCCKE